MIEVINLDKLSNDGFKQPANDPTSNTPDNITHAQLRYNTFTSSFAIQGTVIVGASSTFQFTIPDNLTYTLFKLYTSTNGITYNERKSYGGSLGKTINLSRVTERFLLLNFKQSATSDPVVTIANTFNEVTIDSSIRDTVGTYTVYFSTTFLQETTLTMPPQCLFSDISAIAPIGFIWLLQSSTDYITFGTLNLSNVLTDNLVYPNSPTIGVLLPIKIVNLVNN